MEKKGFRLLRIIGLFYLSCFFYHPLYTQQELHPEITRKFVESPSLVDAHVGINIISLATNKKLVAYQDERNFIPASTLKLFYTLAAVDRLGSDFRYETKIMYHGDILSDGSLEGDLIIQASGDPSFASDRFSEKQSWVNALKAIVKKIENKGIRCIDGDLILLLPYRSYPINGSWPFEDLGNYYAGGAHPFNFNENIYSIEFESPKNEGQSCPVISIEPQIPFLKIKSQLVSADRNSGDQAYVHAKAFDHNIEVWGSIPAGRGSFVIDASIPDPALTFAQLLSDALGKATIGHDGYQIRDTYSGKMQVIGVHRSRPLLDLASVCNDYSINLYAEALGKLLLQEERGSVPFSYPDEKQWESLFDQYGVGSGSVSIVDACGLSPQNLLSPKSMTSFLIEMVDRLGENKVLEIIPQAGQAGLAKNFLRDEKLRDHLWLKSGSIRHVLNYAGFFRGKKSGQLYAFCIFSNQGTSPASRQKREIEKYLEEWIKSS